MKLLDIYKGIAQVNAGVGDTILFWKGLWNAVEFWNKAILGFIRSLSMTTFA
jgi:hypothetical protein